MAQYLIDIDDEAVREQISRILNTVIADELERRYGGSADVVRDAVKELIYEHKEEILERVIDRASKELVKKGLPKLLERMES